MNKKIVMALLLAAVAAAAVFAQDLPLTGWSAWGGIRAVASGNTVTLTGNVDVAGYVNEHLDPGLRDRTVTLVIRNAGNSVFSQNRMIKITVNNDDQLVRPANVSSFIFGEYVPSSVSQIEFTLPSDFDGKLGFVFYQAELKDLQITATYR